MMNYLWTHCPICNHQLDGGLYTGKCPQGHYEYCAAGSYACNIYIIVDGNTESFHLDEGSDDSKKFWQRIKQLRPHLLGLQVNPSQ